MAAFVLFFRLWWIGMATLVGDDEIR